MHHGPSQGFVYISPKYLNLHKTWKQHFNDNDIKYFLFTSQDIEVIRWFKLYIFEDKLVTPVLIKPCNFHP